MTDARPLEGLRVVHLSTVHRVSDPRIRLKECRTLTKAGAHVRLIARQSTIEVDDDVDVVALPPIRSRRDRIIRSQRAALRAVRDFAPDVVHFHDPELLLLAPFLRRIAPVLIYDVHESLPDLVLDREWIPTWARGIVGSLCRRLEPFLSRFCSAYVLVDKRWAPRFPNRPWIELHNPPLTQEFEPADRTTPPVQAHFVYVGELLPERGIFEAVDAINLVDGPVLTLAGPLDAKLEARLRERDRSGRVELPGLVSRAEVTRLLRSATAGLVLLEPVPAYDTAFATKILEYANAGLPMILSDTTAHRRFSADHGCGLVVEYGNIAALGDAFRALAESPKRWLDQSRASLAAAKAHPSWDDIDTRLVDLYSSLDPRS